MMKKILNKIKSLFVTNYYDDYIFLEPLTYLTYVEPERVNQLDKNKLPFFIEFIGGKFNNWIIEINISYDKVEACVHRVPRKVTEKEVNKSIPKIKKIIVSLFS